MYLSASTPDVGAVTVTVICPSPVTAVGAPGALGARKTVYTFFINGVLAVPAKT